MRDVFLVRGLQRRRNLTPQPQHFVERQRTLQRRALHELHDKVVRTDVVQRADVGMVERRHRAGLALEAFGELLLGSLDGDNAVETRISRLPHLTPPALPYGLQNFVRA